MRFLAVANEVEMFLASDKGGSFATNASSLHGGPPDSCTLISVFGLQTLRKMRPITLFQNDDTALFLVINYDNLPETY